MTKVQRSQSRREAHRRSIEKTTQRRKVEKPSPSGRRIATDGRIFPDVFYPLIEARAFLGLGNTQLWEHINAGHLPKPVAPCEGSSQRGYYGRTILKIQSDAEARAAM